ncbi:HNH endonuclease [Bacillus paranthracis]
MNKFCRYCGKSVPIDERCSCRPVRKSHASKSHVSSHRRFQKLRKRIIDRDNGYCQRCVIKFGKYNKMVHEGLQCHHIKSLRDFPHLAYDENNLITVCQRCNFELGNSNVLDFEWQPNEVPITL